jgi:ATP-binding cassette subfamily B protein/subfamily B ATP-binding cassette protein MsbA
VKLWWQRLSPYAHPYWGGLALVTLLMLLGVVIDVLKPWPMKLIVDYVLTRQPLPDGAGWIARSLGGTALTDLLGWLVGATLVLFLASSAIQMTQVYVKAGVGARMSYDLGAELFDHLQRLTLTFHGRHNTGDLARRVINNSGFVRDLVMGVFFPALTSLLTLAIMFAVMWRLDRSLSLLALLVTLPLGLLIRLLARPMSEHSYRQQQLEGEIMSLAEQTLTALPVIQVFGREEYEAGRFRRLSQRTVRAYLRTLASQLQFKVGTSAVTAASTAAFMVIGGVQVLSGSLSLGSLLVFLSYLAALYAPLETLAYMAMGFASASGGARRVFEVFEAKQEVTDRAGAEPLPACSASNRGGVRLEEVTVGYHPGHPILKNISLEALPGQTVAIVGPTGAGKTTLVSLIPRFPDPWEGRVMGDGHDVREVQLKSLRSQIALVLQDPFLFPLTMAENIAYGRPEASPEEIESAARAANAHDFIVRLPQGYETMVGERGITLSGGERQRLSIARALLKNAPILILDEPTSALDAQTEAKLAEALRQLQEGRTTFVIAHRLSTIRRADLIVVLEGGMIAEAGAHGELLARKGVYSQFYNIQLRCSEASTERPG